MKKRLLTGLLVVAMSLSMVACSEKVEKKQYFGDDSKEIQSMLDTFFDAYEKCDAEKANECVGPESVTFQKLHADQIAASDYPRVYFMKMVGISNAASYAANIDLARSNAKDEFDKLASRYEDSKVKIKYDIKEVKSSSDVETFYTRSGLALNEKDILEYLNTAVGVEVEDYYAITADIDITYDGKETGSQQDKEELANILVKATGTMSEKQANDQVDDYFKNIEKEVTFFVYKYDNKWYVYSNRFIIISHSGEFSFEKPNAE